MDSRPHVSAPPPSSAPRALPFGEFVALMAFMMALVALSIDAMLPALPDIGADLGVTSPNDVQLIVSVLFLGLAFGQMLYGPLSDATGRKPSVYLGFALFVVGSVVSLLAPNLNVMLAGRFLQGLGLAGPRVVSVALIRDQYEGRAMARVMSFVMSVFIFVPAVAPALGQAILWLAPWRAIFVILLVLGVAVSIWFALRQPETLPPDARAPLRLLRVAAAVREICVHPVAFGYTLAAGLVSSAFLGYLSSAQQIFGELYGQGDRFALFFGGLALCIGSASFLNGTLVMRFGMHVLSHGAMFALALWSAAFFVLGHGLGGALPLWLFTVYLGVALFFVGILFGNLNAQAMEPLGHIVGVGAAVVGSLVTFISVPFGVWIGQAYDGTVLPLIAGFAACAGLALPFIWRARRFPMPSAEAPGTDLLE